MAAKNRRLGSDFKKGFDAVYHAKVCCPVCKERIFANALVCPMCQTDFRKSPYSNQKSWQKSVLNFLLIISIVIGFLIAVSGIPVIFGFIGSLVCYGVGYVVVQKIQSFKNYHQK